MNRFSREFLKIYSQEKLSKASKQTNNDKTKENFIFVNGMALEMAQPLRSSAAIAENLSSVSSTGVQWLSTKYNSSSGELLDCNTVNVS